MSAFLKLGLGLLCFLLGLGYLYRPDLIERLNAFMRESVFNDSHIALERRKWGAFFLLIAFLFLYMGFSVLERP